MAQIETVREILESVSPDQTENGNDEDDREAENPENLNEGSQKRRAKSCRWKPTSSELLAEAEGRILSRLKSPYKARHVNIGPVVGSSDCEIWTVSMNEKGQGTPIVLLHGFGAGVAFWSLNLDTLATTRPVYAIDHLGFGRSSRPKFSTNPTEAERQFATAIEEWRKAIGLPHFVLLGHSFGGFLAMAYTLCFPERVKGLVLADPWGFTEKPKEIRRNVPFWIKAIAFVMRPLNPFAVIRVAGPMGQNLLERARPDLMNKFSELNEEGEDIKFGEYVYHCNAQHPSGESAFHTMMTDFGWAKLPMIRRIPDLPTDLDVTAIYGSSSWVEPVSQETFQELRNGGYTNVQILQGAGHHVYSDGKDEFNAIVLQSSLRADGKK